MDKKMWIREREEIRTTMTDEQFFCSEPARDSLNEIIMGITKAWKKVFKVRLLWENPTVTAFTDGTTVGINANCSFLEGETRTNKWYLLIGGIIHEVGHILWTPFSHQIDLCNGLSRGIIPSRAEEGASSNKYLKRGIDEITSNPKLARAWARYLKEVENIIEDGFLEPAMMRLVRGYAECLRSRRAKKWEVAQSIDMPKPMEATETMFQTQIALSQIWQRALWGEVKGEAEAVKKIQASKLVSEEIYPLIDAAVAEKDCYVRGDISVKIVLVLAGIIAEIAEEEHETGEVPAPPSSEDSESESSSGKGNPESSENSENESKDGEDSEGESEGEDGDLPSHASSDPYGDEEDESKSEGSDKDGESESSKSSEGGKESEGKDTPSKEDLESDIDKAIESFMDEHEKEDEHRGGSTPLDSKGEMASDTSDAESGDTKSDSKSDTDALEALERDAADAILAERYAERGLERDKKILDTCQKDDKYRTGYKIARGNASKTYKKPTDIDAKTKKFANGINKLIKEKLAEDKQDLLLMGKVNTSSLYREDKRYFAKNTLPGETPDMEFLIVVDESGSMGGPKVEEAKLAAYELYRAARLIGVKATVVSQTTTVYGHDPKYEPVRILVYADSEDGNTLEKDCNNILSIGEKGLYNNRDGYAYRYAVRRLAKHSNASKKVVFNISDGEPAAAAYFGVEAKADIRRGLEEAQKNGIETVTFGFGDCCEDIKSVWVEDFAKKIQPKFIAVENIDELPKKMLRVFDKMLDL